MALLIYVVLPNSSHSTINGIDLAGDIDLPGLSRSMGCAVQGGWNFASYGQSVGMDVHTGI